jgi:hypothetical protein
MRNSRSVLVGLLALGLALFASLAVAQSQSCRGHGTLSPGGSTCSINHVGAQCEVCATMCAGTT